MSPHMWTLPHRSQPHSKHSANADLSSSAKEYVDRLCGSPLSNKVLCLVASRASSRLYRASCILDLRNTQFVNNTLVGKVDNISHKVLANKDTEWHKMTHNALQQDEGTTHRILS